MVAINNYSRPSADQAVAVDVVTAVQESVTLCQAQIREAGVSLDLHLPGDHPQVWMPPADLVRVLTNLLVNACDAVTGLPDGSIDVAVGNGDGVTLTVADNGQGMTEEQKGRVFELFYTTKGVKGHGIGLYQCYNIVTGCGGRIGVETAPGQGAAFHIWLPTIIE